MTPKPVTFWTKLVALVTIQIGITIGPAWTAYENGHALAALGMTLASAALVGLSYALDPNYAAPSAAQFVSGLSAISTVLEATPIAQKVETLPIVGSIAKTAVDSEVKAEAPVIAADLGLK